MERKYERSQSVKPSEVESVAANLTALINVIKH